MVQDLMLRILRVGSTTPLGPKAGHWMGLLPLSPKKGPYGEHAPMGIGTIRIA